MNPIPIIPTRRAGIGLSFVVEEDSSGERRRPGAGRNSLLILAGHADAGDQVWHAKGAWQYTFTVDPPAAAFTDDVE
jgi:hypothetical protein